MPFFRGALVGAHVSDYKYQGRAAVCVSALIRLAGMAEQGSEDARHRFERVERQLLGFDHSTFRWAGVVYLVLDAGERVATGVYDEVAAVTGILSRAPDLLAFSGARERLGPIVAARAASVRRAGESGRKIGREPEFWESLNTFLVDAGQGELKNGESLRVRWDRISKDGVPDQFPEFQTP